MNDLETLKGLLASVRVRIDAQDTCAGLNVLIYSQNLDLDWEESELAKEKYPNLSYEEWVNIIHPIQKKESLLLYSNSSLFYGSQTIDELAFKELCQNIFSEITKYEQNLQLKSSLHRAALAPMRICQGRNTSWFIEQAYRELNETRPELKLPELQYLTLVNSPEIQSRIESEAEKLHGKIVHIPDLSLFKKFHKEETLLFNPQHDSYMTCLRDDFREELREYLNRK